MDIGKTLYVRTRTQWRTWLRRHHRTAGEIWLIYYKLGSGKPRISYNDAVEEALCFGWIDSILKPIDKEKYAQRFSPRKPGSRLSAMNRERVQRLIRSRTMTAAGLAAIKHAFSPSAPSKRTIVPPDILRALKENRAAWDNFRKFPASYKRIRIGWIEAARPRRAVFRQRLRFFVKMSAQNKRFGMVQ